MRRPSHTLGLWIALLVVAVVVAGVHWTVLSAQATTSDDQQYLLDNKLVQDPSWASFSRFFGEVLNPSTVSGYYQPVAMTSLMIDCALGGTPDDFRAFHRTALLLHALNAVLVTLLLYLLFGNVWVASAVGLLFGVHPLTVETVAWLAERKTLLATFFSLGVLVIYVLYTRKRTWVLLAVACAVFALALLSKPTSTPLPLLLLLLDYWPLRRLSLRALLEKIPFLVLAGVSAIITTVSQSRAGGETVAVVDSALRVPLTLCHNIVFYLGKIAWPIHVTSHYPYPQPFTLADPMLLTGLIGTILLLALLLVSWRWTRGFVVGWLFFFVAVFPTMGVIGFTDVIAANRYAYLPMLGLLLILAWLLASAWDRAAHMRQRVPVRIGLAVAVLCLAVLGARSTRQQLGVWQDTTSLHRYMLRFAPNAGPLHVNLAGELNKQGRVTEAIEHYSQALEAGAGSHTAHYNLGVLLAQQGRVEEACRHYAEALPSKAWGHYAHNNLGVVFLEQGRFADAMAHFEHAIGRSADFDLAYTNMLRAAMASRDPALYARVYPHFERWVQRKPLSAEAHNALASALVQRGDRTRAHEEFRTALRLAPDFVFAHDNFATSLLDAGQFEEAAEQYRAVIRLRADYLPAYGNLGQVLMQLGRVTEAISVYESALRVAPNDPRLLAALRDARSRESSSTKP